MEEETQDAPEDDPSPTELIRRARAQMMAAIVNDPRCRALAVTKLEEAALWWDATLRGGALPVT